MDFHDFPKYLGKSGCQFHPTPKLCAGLFQSTAGPGARGSHGEVRGARLGLGLGVGRHERDRGLVRDAARVPALPGALGRGRRHAGLRQRADFKIALRSFCSTAPVPKQAMLLGCTLDFPR